MVVFDWVDGPRLFGGIVEKPGGRHELVQRPGGTVIGMRHRERHWWFVVGLSTHLEGDRGGRGRDGGAAAVDVHTALPPP